MAKKDTIRTLLLHLFFATAEQGKHSPNAGEIFTYRFPFHYVHINEHINIILRHHIQLNYKRKPI